MLRVRGKEEDIKEFLSYFEEERKKTGEEMPVFRDISTVTDKENGTVELCHDLFLSFESAQVLCNRLPELKVCGWKVFGSGIIESNYYWSKPGASHITEAVCIGEPEDLPGQVGEWWYKEDTFGTEIKEDGSLIITKYYRWDEEIYIPEEIDGRPVTELADNLFYGNPVVTDIYLGENVQTVGSSTFSSCHKLLLHTDSPSVKETLKKTRVMISSSDDTAEEISLKRDFVYKASGKGITLYSYRSDEDRLTVPDLLDGIEVRKLAKKAFYGKKMFSLTLPATVTEFDSEVFEKGELLCLAAPGIDPGKVKSVIWKQALARGFLLKYSDGIYTDKKITDAYMKYLKPRTEQYADDCVGNPELLYGLLYAVKLTPGDYEKLIAVANEKGELEAKTLLLDHQNNSITEEQMALYESRKLEKELSGPTLTELRKQWSYEVLSDGTVRLVSYKGTDVDVIIPGEIEGKPVTAIGKYTFVALYTDEDNQQMREVRKRRQKVKTISIHSGISEIGEYAFIGCGDTSIPENARVYNFRWFDEKRKAQYPPKAVLMVEKGSFAEGFVKKENIPFIEEDS